MAEPAWKSLPIVAEAPPEEPAWKSLPIIERNEANAAKYPGYVGEVQPGEEPWRAAARMGRPFLGPENMEQVMSGVQDATVREGIAKPAIAATQGALLGFGDELAAGAETAKNAVLHPIDSGAWKGIGALKQLAQQYDANHADWSRITDESTKDNPGANLLGAVAMPNPLAGAKLGGRLLGMAGLGAARGLGDSKASLVNGEVAPALRDTATGGAVGLAAGALAETVAAPIRALMRRVGGEKAGAAAAAQQLEQAAADKAAASAKSVVGNIGTSQANAVRHVQEVLASPHLYEDGIVEEAMRVSQTPMFRDLVARAEGNNISKLADLAPSEDAARAVWSQAQASAAAPAVAQRAAQKLEGAPQEFAKKLWQSVGQRAALTALGSLAGGAVGYATGHEGAGLTAGAGLGWATPGVLAFARSAAANPRFQHAALQSIEHGLMKGEDVADQAVRFTAPAVLGNKDSAWGDLLSREPTPEEKARALAAALRAR